MARPALPALALALAIAAPLPAAPQPAPSSAAQAAARLVPVEAEAALLCDGEACAASLVPFVAALGARAPSLRPDRLGRDLLRTCGVDLLSPAAQAAAGLAPAGPRVLVFAGGAAALSAPLSDPARARAALAAWLEELGPARAAPAPAPKGARLSGTGRQQRAGLVAGQRLLTASGRAPAALLARLAQLAQGRKGPPALGQSPLAGPALARLRGPLSLWLRLRAPLHGAALDLEGSAQGLAAAGLLAVEGKEPLLAGSPPAEEACAGAPLLCVRAAPGPALRALAAEALLDLVALAAPAGEAGALAKGALAAAEGGALLRVESVDVLRLLERAAAPPLDAAPFLLASRARAPLALPSPLPAGLAPAGADGVALGPLCLRTLPDALLAGVPCPQAPPPGLAATGPPALWARLETAALARALAPLTALDALRSPQSAALFAAKALWGPLLALSGAPTLALRPGPEPHLVEVEARWPLLAPAPP